MPAYCTETTHLANDKKQYKPSDRCRMVFYMNSGYYSYIYNLYPVKTII